jgi:hypothetical protein
MAKVGVALALIVVEALDAAVPRHRPVAGLVWQIERASGKLAAPVLAVAVIAAVAPTFTVATANAFAPELPGMWRMPSLVAVAASATMSGTGVAEAESNSVFRPGKIGGPSRLEQRKPSATSLGPNGAIGANAMTKLWAAPAARLTGVLGWPVRALVAGLVVW